MDRSVMSQLRSVNARLQLLAATFVLAMTLATAATAHAQGFGELGKPFGKAGKGSGAFSLPVGNSVHAMGVDPTDNSGYVVDEEKEENSKGETEFCIQK